jgi:branched-subunit amino acid transport protein AzlD
MLVILLAYSVKDTPWVDIKTTLITLGSLLLAILLHKWKRNALVSIFVPTLVYMGLGYYLV